MIATLLAAKAVGVVAGDRDRSRGARRAGESARPTTLSAGVVRLARNEREGGCLTRRPGPLQRIAAVLGAVPATPEAAPAAIATLIAELGLPQHIAAFGLSKEDLEEAVGPVAGPEFPREALLEIMNAAWMRHARWQPMPTACAARGAACSHIGTRSWSSGRVRP